MLKRVLKPILLVSLILGITVGCGIKKTEVELDKSAGENNVTTQEVVDAITSTPATLDPSICNSIDEMNLDAQMFEGLYRKGVNGKIEYGTAESVQKSSDNLTYTFNLRKDAKWSDGKPVTAYDYEYAWKRVLTPGFETDVDYMMFFIKDAQKYRNGKTKDLGIKVIDNSTLEVELEKPTPYFEQLLTFHTYYPLRKDIVEREPKVWAEREDTLIGNGPFIISKIEKGANIPYIEMNKNENYWDSKNVKLSKITTKIIDGEAQWENFKQNNIDIGLRIPKDKDINQLLKDKEIISAPSLTTEYYIFNIKKKPFDNVKVRQAINMVIDRNRIVDEVKRGAYPATGFVPFGIPDKSNDLDFRKIGGDYIHSQVSETDITEARELLAQAGYPDGKNFPTLKLLINDTASNNSISAIFKESVEKRLNIKTEVVSLDSALFKEERNNTDFDICRMNWVADFADASNFLELFVTGSSNNKQHWSNKEYDRLIIEASNSVDEAVRMERLHDAEKIMINEASILPIYFDSNIFYYKPYVKNFTRSPLEEKNFRIVYIDKNN